MSFRTKNTPFQITKPSYEEPVSGIIATAMTAGALVAIKNSGAAGSPVELVACGAGQRPAILELDVVSNEVWQAYHAGNDQYRRNLRTPIPVGEASSARFAHEAEYEGADFFNGINGATAAGSPLKVVAGKFEVADVAIPDGGGTPDRVVAYLVRLVEPHDSASFRWLVEFVD